MAVNKEENADNTLTKKDKDEIIRHLSNDELTEIFIANIKCLYEILEEKINRECLTFIFKYGPLEFTLMGEEKNKNYYIRIGRNLIRELLKIAKELNICVDENDRIQGYS